MKHKELNNKQSVTILVADDDTDDVQMIKEAFQEIRLLNNLQFVSNGEELMSYLKNEGPYADAAKFPAPRLILLDLNMPRKDGREALKEIKSHEIFRRIPVIMLTTSRAEEDILKSYNLGANSFITKPVGFGSLVTILKDLGHYWLEIVELPHCPENIKK